MPRRGWMGRWVLRGSGGEEAEEGEVADRGCGVVGGERRGPVPRSWVERPES